MKPSVSSTASPDGDRSALGKIAVFSLLLFLGAIEGWFKRTDFSTDAISYLDISRAIPAENWKLVFNPMWSVGYPFLISTARVFFPRTPGGEWMAIHVLNLFIFLGAWAAFTYLLHSPLPDSPVTRERQRFLQAAALFIFIAIQLCIDSVSRVGPDLLVTMLFFLAVGILLRLLQSPSVLRSAALGGVLGIGYWVKAIYLPLSIVVLGVAAAALLWRKQSIKSALIALLTLVLVGAPYAAGLSWSFGRFTLGEAGNLNYAFHVNLLPHWTNWQGGSSPIYGRPIHPTREVLKDPLLFVFAEPYHNTYPPFGNIVYWYEGYHHFFSSRRQVMAILHNLFYLARILFEQPIFYAVAFSISLLWFTVEDKRKWMKKTLGSWPLFAPAALGIAAYALVHLEDRYLGSFLAILCVLPFVTLCLLDAMPTRKVQIRALAILAIGAAVNLAIVDRQVFHNIRTHSYYTNNPEWTLASDLRTMGLHPGDAVAAVGGPNASCTWAYIDGLRIVAELGGEPYDPLHPRSGPAENDAAPSSFWRSSPALQDKILSLLRETGAAAVTAPEKPPDVNPSGWRRAAGTDVWVYRLLDRGTPEHVSRMGTGAAERIF